VVTTAPEPILRIRRLGKWFGDLQVLRGIDLTVHRGHVVVIIGPSGSGKSTLLRCINYLEPFQEGEILILGELLRGTRERSAEEAKALAAQLRRLRPRPGIYITFIIDDLDTMLQRLVAAGCEMLASREARGTSRDLFRVLPRPRGQCAGVRAVRRRERVSPGSSSWH
jgi:polar amino acid transport system ATP-binding protein